MGHYKHDYLKHKQTILADQLGVDECEITPERTLRELGADSLDDVELIMAFEEEYSIEISNEDAERIRTVKDIVGYLESRMGNSVLNKRAADK